MKTSSLSAEENHYAFHVDMVCEYYLNGLEITDEMLLQIIPYSNEEFNIFYEKGTMEIRDTPYELFTDISRAVFHKASVQDRIEFYNAALRLASFADGEFAEYYHEELEGLIAMDTGRFCAMAKGQTYAHYNPIKYYLEEHNCDNRFN
ncbi:MAG: hypothetical protein KTR22_05510 [Flavobacteriaceae bacterium]|nr:hypothetical protein [Flavobacteriaceae bacterium]